MRNPAGIVELIGLFLGVALLSPMLPACGRSPASPPSVVVASTWGSGRVRILDLSNPGVGERELTLNDDGIVFDVFGTDAGMFVIQSTGLQSGQLLQLNTATGELVPAFKDGDVVTSQEWSCDGRWVFALVTNGIVGYDTQSRKTARIKVPGIDSDGGIACTDSGVVVHLDIGSLVLVNPANGSAVPLVHVANERGVRVVGGFEDGVVVRHARASGKPPSVALVNPSSSALTHPIAKAIQANPWASPHVVRMEGGVALAWVDEVRQIAIVKDMRTGRETRVDHVSFFCAAALKTP